MTLHEWGIFHGSDKAHAHNYLNFYEAKIGLPHSILEFGVLNGASLKMWRDKYNAFVIGLDIEKKQPINGITVLQMDATHEIRFINLIQTTGNTNSRAIDNIKERV